MSRGLRITLPLTLAALALLLIAPAAMAADGVGIWGRTDDKVVTFFSLAVLVFIAIFVTVMSVLQHRLESRKERAREDLERLRGP